VNGATEPGWALRRLVMLHDNIRDDLLLLRQLVVSIGQGQVKREETAAVFGRLSFRERGWTLRTYCAGFCSFVHQHHTTEESVLFPMLLGQQNGNLRDVIEKLRADHRVLAELLDDVESAVDVLPADPAATAAATEAIERLAEQLQAHLSFEERGLAAALEAMSLAVSEDDVPSPPADARAFRAEIDATLTRPSR
jgi:hypothetical protein